MTRDEAAAVMNGREYTNEITDSEAKAWAESGLVIIFGASDDLCELRGARHQRAGEVQWKSYEICKSLRGTF